MDERQLTAAYNALIDEWIGRQKTKILENAQSLVRILETALPVFAHKHGVVLEKKPIKTQQPATYTQLVRRRLANKLREKNRK